MTQAPPDLLTSALEKEIEAVRVRAALAGDEVTPLLDAAYAAVRGGKMLRARLCLAAADSCGAAATVPGSPELGVAVALELFQSAALVHDDLIDGSATRRGAPAAHRLLAAHSPSIPRADAFGAAGAILLGDLLLVLSGSTLRHALDGADASRAREVEQLYAAMSAEVAFGQYLDLVAARAPWGADGGLERAWRVVTAKSARYSVELPLAMGARLAGADDAAETWFTGLGRHVGIAFQLRDDLLGVFGDPATTGKPSGDDLREGKRTVLVALAHQGADPAQRELLERLLGSEDLDDDGVAALREVLLATGASDAVEALIAEHAEQATAALARPPAGVTPSTTLVSLLHDAVVRTS